MAMTLPEYEYEYDHDLKLSDILVVLYNLGRPPNYEIENPDIASSIRCSLTGYNQEDFEHYTKDTGMSVLFLGTGAGMPTKTRSTTSTLLRLGGSAFLFDAGEGVQRQMSFTRAKPSQVDRIFITHLHGDHIFGLPGFLLGLQHSVMISQNDLSAQSKVSKQQQQQHKRQPTNPNAPRHVIKIYGPPGLYNYIAANIVLSCTKFHSIHIEVHELVGGRVRRKHGIPKQRIRNPFEASYPEFNFGFLTRHSVEPIDGIWTLEEGAPPLTREAALTRKYRSNGRLQMSDDRTVQIQAAEVDHLSGIATFGFSVQEDEPARNIDAPKAQSLGVSPSGQKYDLLKYGFSVETDDGSATVYPHQVLKPKSKKARKVVVVGDNRGWTPQMSQLAEKADILIHEATLTEEDWVRGHSTAEMAGRVSGQSKAEILILNHISSKSDHIDATTGRSGQLDLIDKAREASNGISDVMVAYDFMELLVPRHGFRPLEDDDDALPAVDQDAGGEPIVREETTREGTATATLPTSETEAEFQSLRSTDDSLVKPSDAIQKLFGGNTGSGTA